MPSKLPIEETYHSLDDIINGLAELQEIFRAGSDERGVFVTAYLIMTREIKRKAENKFFLDNDWVRLLAISFANLYRVALLNYERQDFAAMPKAWRIAFDAAVNDTALVIQDLALGINAHINRDLPFAVIEAGIEPLLERFKDYTEVNQVLKDATRPIEESIGRIYAPGLGVLGKALGPIGAEITNFDVDKARQHSWVAATVLANAKDDSQRAAVAESLDDSSAVMARLILSPTAEFPFLLPLLRHLEQDKPWWQNISLPEPPFHP